MDYLVDILCVRNCFAISVHSNISTGWTLKKDRMVIFICCFCGWFSPDLPLHSSKTIYGNC